MKKAMYLTWYEFKKDLQKESPAQHTESGMAPNQTARAFALGQIVF